MEIAAIAAVALLAVITLFQAALALGAPWGHAAWGGRHPGVLPTRLRIASGVAAVVVYPLVMVYVLAASGLITADLPGSDGPAMWILAVLFTIGAIMNLISPSRLERIWGPVSGVIALCCAVIALGM
ncbi:hypothetical protein BH24CHL9_BH24CHL9_01780 [soil metagenome]